MAYDDLIYSTALADGMPPALAACIVAQSKHETNDYTSAVFVSCNNAFGYSAVTNSCPGHEAYQAYNNVQDSVHELTAWIKRRVNEGNFPPLQLITTPEVYAQLLADNGYYTDSVSNYTAGLKRWFTTNFGTIAAVSGAGIIAALAVFLIVFRKELHIYKR